MMLYVRMAITIIISLYTSKIVLKILGVEDYGVYSVVGGIAVLFSFFNNALYTSTQRFLTFKIGEGNEKEVQRVFYTSINCHIVIAIIILILSEIIGIWLLNNKLNIPEERMNAANIVFQLSLFTSVLGVLNSPYIASIIAYERMTFFAWTSIFDSVSKLLIVYLLTYKGTDKLIFYSAILFSWSIIKILIDRSYCYLKFKHCRYRLIFHKKLFLTIMNFSIWNLFRTGAVIGVNQGNNILANVFGGPVASAAMGISNQVNGTIYTFMQNVQTAFNPQITKNYANGNMADFHSLIIQSAKFSSFLLLFIAIPLFINTEFILDLWLKDVPAHTTNLCRLSIISVYLDSLTGPLNTAVMSKGRIKKYQIVTSILWTLAIPLAWFLLSSGLKFDNILIVKILSQICTLVYGLIYLRQQTGMPVGLYFRNVVLNSLTILIATNGLIYILIKSFCTNEIQMLVASVSLTVILLPAFIFSIGLTHTERYYLFDILKKTINSSEKN